MGGKFRVDDVESGREIEVIRNLSGGRVIKATIERNALFLDFGRSYTRVSLFPKGNFDVF